MYRRTHHFVNAGLPFTYSRSLAGILREIPGGVPGRRFIKKYITPPSLYKTGVRITHKSREVGFSTGSRDPIDVFEESDIY